MKVRDLKKDNFINYLCDSLEIKEGKQEIELGFYLLHGNKKLNSKVEEVLKNGGESEIIVNALMGVYGNKWKTLLELNKERINLDDYNLVTTEKVEDSNNSLSVRSDNNKSDNQNYVGSFDSSDLIEDSKVTSYNNNESKNSSNNERNKVVTREVKGNRENRLDNYFKVLKNLNMVTFNDIIFKDITDTITVLIY